MDNHTTKSITDKNDAYVVTMEHNEVKISVINYQYQKNITKFCLPSFLHFIKFSLENQVPHQLTKTTVVDLCLLKNTVCKTIKYMHNCNIIYTDLNC